MANTPSAVPVQTFSERLQILHRFVNTSPLPPADKVRVLFADIPLNAYLIAFYGGQLPKSMLELRFAVALEMSVFACLSSLCTHLNEYRRIYEECQVEPLARLCARIARVLFSKCAFEGVAPDAQGFMLFQAINTAVLVMFPEEPGAPEIPEYPINSEGSDSDDDSTLLQQMNIFTYVQSALTPAEFPNINSGLIERIDACFRSLGGSYDMISLQAAKLERARIAGLVGPTYDVTDLE